MASRFAQALAENLASIMGVFLLAYLAIIFVLFLLVHAIIALPLFIIAGKTKTPHRWLAWVPFVNLFYTSRIARSPWWSALVLFLPLVHGVGAVFLAAVTVWWWWRIAVLRHKPGWLGILVLIPFVNIVLLFYLAFSRRKH